MKNYELVLKAKIELHLFQQYFTPHTPPLKQGESETTLSPDLPSTRITRSIIPIRKCFKSSNPMSDLVTRYGPQATMRFTMSSFSTIRTRNLYNRMSVNKEKNIDSFLTGAQDSHLHRVTTPEAAYIQLRHRPPEDEQGNARNI
jgi:hypothetical protein